MERGSLTREGAQVRNYRYELQTQT